MFKKLFHWIDDWLVTFRLFGLLDDTSQEDYYDSLGYTQAKTKDFGQEFHDAENVNDNELRMPLMHSTDSLDGLHMHRPPLADRFGTLRFKTELVPDRDTLRVTVIDAWDLPPMDSDGKADPYVEVSLRPGKEKFTTAIKANCLNPTFNETAELKWIQSDKSDKDLVLKVMDSDFPLQDELIGVIRLPVNSLGLSTKTKTFTCLILHEKEKKTKGHALSYADAAKFNLKISQQANDLYELELALKNLKDELEEAKEAMSTLRKQKIEIEWENYRLIQHPKSLSEDSLEEGLYLSDPGGKKNTTCSAPVSSGESPTCGDDGKDKGCFELLSHMYQCIDDRDREISQLKHYIESLRPQLINSCHGQIDIGLSFFHVGSKLRIDIMHATKLRAVNLFNDQSDPFAKVKIFHDGKSSKWKFETRTVWKTLSPVWNEHFILSDITEADLPHMYIEITVYDKGRFRSAQPLGQVRIGPNQTYDSQHWEDMIKRHGNIVTMTHALRAV